MEARSGMMVRTKGWVEAEVAVAHRNQYGLSSADAGDVEATDGRERQRRLAMVVQHDGG